MGKTGMMNLELQMINTDMSQQFALPVEYETN